MRHKFGQGRLLHKFSTFLLPFCGAPSRRKQSLRQRSSFTCRPAQRRIFFSWWSGGPFQGMEAARKGLGEGANGPAEHTCNASGHCTGLWDNTMVYAVWPWQSSCCWNVTTADLLRWYTCMRLQQLPSPCPLLLPSRLRPPGTRPRAYPPPTDEPSLAVKSRHKALFSCIFISACGGIHQHL